MRRSTTDRNGSCRRDRRHGTDARAADPTSPPHPARGFGLIEAIVALAVLAILAAVLVPATAAFAAADRVDRAVADLERVQDAVDRFIGDVGQCPAGLDQLVFPLQDGDQDLLGDGYNPGTRNRWDGPYYHRALPTTGPVTGVGTITGLRLVETAPDDVPGIVVDADRLDATALDRSVDSGDGAAAGTVRWTAASGERVDLEYYLPITCPSGPGGGPPGGGPPGGGPPGGGPPGGGPPGGGPPGGGPPGG